MRGPERTLGDNTVGIFKQAGNGMDLGGLQYFGGCHVRQYRGQAFGQHGFTAAGSADEDHIVPAGSGHFKAPFNSIAGPLLR